MRTRLEIDVLGFFCNQWPSLEIYHDDRLIFDETIESQRYLQFELDCQNTNSSICLRHKNKRFGEDGVWDTDTSGQDRYLEIKDIRFDSVSIGRRIMSNLWFDSEWSELQKQINDLDFIQQNSRFLCYGRMGFNGRIKLDFEFPIYNWLIINKYKLESIEKKSYFSQYQENWHYERDFELIKEIKDLMKFD
jgi:hypothetical protein